MCTVGAPPRKGCLRPSTPRDGTMTARQPVLHICLCSMYGNFTGVLLNKMQSILDSCINHILLCHLTVLGLLQYPRYVPYLFTLQQYNISCSCPFRRAMTRRWWRRRRRCARSECRGRRPRPKRATAATSTSRRPRSRPIKTLLRKAPGLGLPCDSEVYCFQCCGSESESRSTGSTCFWASRSRIRILLSSCKNSKKNLDSYYFVTLLDFLSLKNDVNVASKSNKQKKFC